MIVVLLSFFQNGLYTYISGGKYKCSYYFFLLFQATYFERDDVALHGFAKRFLENSHEERDHAEKLIKYQNMRGGRVVFKPIAEPNVTEW